MFLGASFNQNISIDVNAVTTMGSIFNGATALSNNKGMIHKTFSSNRTGPMTGLLS